jgi:hypothetical protein
VAAEVKHPYLAVDLEKLKTHRFDKASDLAVFLIGKRHDRYLVLKDQRKPVRVTCAEVNSITKQLEAA